MSTPQTAIITCCVALCATTAFASTVSQNSPSTLGVPYRWFVEMDGTDNAAFSRHVGAWSWEDDSLFNAGLGQPPVGWTHESDWLALVLTEAATVSLRIERDATVPNPISGDPDHLASVASMFPSFTIWSGLDQDTTQVHTYNNRGNIAWAEDILYLDHVDNSTQTFVEDSWVLPAGSYSFAIGSNSPATDLDRQGYRTILTTTPVPEPGATALLAIGAVALARRRRRSVAGSVF